MKILCTQWPLISSIRLTRGIIGAWLRLQQNQTLCLNLRFRHRCLIPLLLASKIPFPKSKRFSLTFRNFAQCYENLRAFGIVLAALSIIFSAVGPVAAWGPVGHETVAYIAQDNLTPAAKTKINALLNGDPADSSLESAQPKSVAQPVLSPQALGQHFKLGRRYPRTRSTGNGPLAFHRPPDPQGHNRQGRDKTIAQDNDCVINQLQIFEGILGDESKPKSKRLEALKFVVHFMGDLHQPLHCADDGDRGGNDKEVRFKAPGHRGHGAKIKLHALWDHLIELKDRGGSPGAGHHP